MEIGQIAEELKLMANTGTKVPGFRRKVMVDIDRVMALSDEILQGVPEDIKEASEVIKMKESIINQAYLEAKRVRTLAENEATALTSAAKEEHETKVDESEIYKSAEQKGQETKEQAALEAQHILQDAQKKAYTILSEAEMAAASRRDGADHYAREVLFNLEEQLADILGEVRRGIDSLKIEVAAAKADRLQNPVDQAESVVV